MEQASHFESLEKTCLPAEGDRFRRPVGKLDEAELIIPVGPGDPVAEPLAVRRKSAVGSAQGKCFP